MAISDGTFRSETIGSRVSGQAGVQIGQALAGGPDGLEPVKHETHGPMFVAKVVCPKHGTIPP